MIRYLFILLALLGLQGALAQETAQLSKKESKFIETVFPEGAIPDELNFHVQDTAGWGVFRTGDRICLVGQQGKLYGYLLWSRAMGRYDYFDYLLAFDTDLSVLGVSITTYRSSHGAAICQKRWLSQFIGYSGEELHLGKEIDAVSGATISAEALVRDLKRCHQFMIRCKEMDLIH